MEKNWKLKIKKLLSNDKRLMAVVLVVAVVITLWIAHDSPNSNVPDDELGLIIPKGFLVVPIELSNARSIAGMIQRKGIIDVFSPRAGVPLVQNLRVIKLSAGEGPLFGALVPDVQAGVLQSLFSGPNLKGAVRTLGSEPTRFHIPGNSKPLLTEVTVSEDL